MRKITEGTQYARGFVSEFTEFIMRGNVVEIAVGLTVGTAFTALVKSLVDNILMPPIGMLLQGSAFRELYIPLTSASYENLAAAEAAGAPVIKYGLFISQVFDFLIVALCIFIVVRIAARVSRRHEEHKEEEKVAKQSARKK